MQANENKIILSAEDITIRVYDSFFFDHTSWQMRKGEQWVFLGNNGSGKSMFSKALAGLLPLKHGDIVHEGTIRYLSFETQQKNISQENRKLDLESAIGKIGAGLTVKKFLGPQFNNFQFKQLFLIQDLLPQQLQTLSTGEMRKVFLIKTLMQKPEILILDEPFDGLDNAAKMRLATFISKLTKMKHIILIVHNSKEILPVFTHMLVMKNCSISIQGKKEVILQSYFSNSKNKIRITNPKVSKNKPNKVLFSLQNVTVTYRNKMILDNVSWEVKEGENWVILGPNGAGKSTLMHIITGDNQQSYANTMTLFGKRKGHEISLWEIKEHIGIFSTELMLKYVKNISAYNIILSGLFDSIGLYQKATQKQKVQADFWIKKLHLEAIAKRDYQQLSFGQKRLILLARAVVKTPKLVIVDEPTHGLDHHNKELILDEINNIGISGKTNIVFITHNPAEILPCMTHTLLLENGKVIAKRFLNTKSNSK